MGFTSLQLKKTLVKQKQIGEAQRRCKLKLMTIMTSQPMV